MNIIGRTQIDVKNFWSKISIPINYKDECWIWTGCRDKNGIGYGLFSLRGSNLETCN